MIFCPQLFYHPPRGAAAARVGEEDENIFTPIRVSHYNLTYRRPWANMLSHSSRMGSSPIFQLMIQLAYCLHTYLVTAVAVYLPTYRPHEYVTSNSRRRLSGVSKLDLIQT